MKLDARLDLRVALFAFAVGLTSGVLAGLLPAIRGTRADLNTVLKSTELRFARSRGWMRQALVVAQVAVALVMLVLSGLFLKSIQVARDSDPGFRVENILTMGFDPRIARYDLQQTRAFYRQLLERVRALPGVRSAGLGQHIPLGVSSSTTEITIDGYEAAPNQQTLTIGSSVVGTQYFDALGIPILRGRAFNAGDTESAPKVVIVNEAMAEQVLAGAAIRLAPRSRSSPRRGSGRRLSASRACRRRARSGNRRSHSSICRWSRAARPA